jgi:hypothetical protein
MITLSIPDRHAGHFVVVLSAAARCRLAPHFWQYAAVSNISAKQDGQLIVASRARQYGHRTTSGATLAPHAGQRQVPASGDAPIWRGRSYVRFDGGGHRMSWNSRY